MLLAFHNINVIASLRMNHSRAHARIVKLFQGCRAQSRRKDPLYLPVGEGGSCMLRGLVISRVKIFWTRADA